MKAIGAQIAALDGNALPLDTDAAEQDEAAPGAGFDALLALVNAQAANTPAPVKLMAPSVGVQSVPAPVQPAKGTTEAAGVDVPANLLSAKRADVGPTQAFLPWLDTTPVVETAPTLPSSDGVAQPDVCDGDAQDAKLRAQLLVDAQRPSAGTAAKEVASANEQLVQSSPVQLLPAEGKEPSAALELPKGSVRKTAVRDTEDAPSVPDAAPANTGTPALLALAAEPKQPSAPVVVASNAPRDSAPSAVGARSPAPVVPAVDTPEVAAPTMFSAELQAQPKLPAASAPAASAPAASALAASAPAPMPMSNPDTGARVTKIEFYETSDEQAVPELPAELTLEPAAAAEGEARSADATDLGNASSEGSATGSEREPAPEAQTTAPAVSAPRFEVTEGKGMRGLDAVVASLLRPYAQKSESKVGARVPTASAPHVSVETGKSQNVKVDERVANVSQTLDAAALRRQEEERSGELRELHDAAPAHMPHQMEMRAEAPLPTDNAPAPTATPLNVPAPMPDPDAAMMGKLARGESLNAAISIEHPELGSMDVVVQNENGRIDVRATLETPRAAAVLRAHESALRYGVQQAGMTFGALRVNARTGEAKVDKSRDVTKRRRERDWEA